MYYSVLRINEGGKALRLFLKNGEKKKKEEKKKKHKKEKIEKKEKAVLSSAKRSVWMY